MDWVTITKQQVENDTLPPVCMACGSLANHRISRTFSFSPEWVQFLYFVFILPGAIADYFLKKEMRVACPLCNEHKNHWSNVVWIASLGWLCVPLLAGLGYLVGSVIDSSLAGASIIGLALGSGLSLISWLGVVIYLASTRIHATKITDDDITFQRLADGFVRAMREQQAGTAKKHYEDLVE